MSILGSMLVGLAQTVVKAAVNSLAKEVVKATSVEDKQNLKIEKLVAKAEHKVTKANQKALNAIDKAKWLGVDLEKHIADKDVEDK